LEIRCVSLRTYYANVVFLCYVTLSHDNRSLFQYISRLQSNLSHHCKIEQVLTARSLGSDVIHRPSINQHNKYPMRWLYRGRLNLRLVPSYFTAHWFLLSSISYPHRYSGILAWSTQIQWNTGLIHTDTVEYWLGPHRYSGILA